MFRSLPLLLESSVYSVNERFMAAKVYYVRCSRGGLTEEMLRESLDFPNAFSAISNPRAHYTPKITHS